MNLSETVGEGLPSFSVILETENLANADLNDLFESLSSFANQDLPPTSANEVLLIESGDTPAQVLEQLQAKYSWIKVHWAQSGIDYYDAKMLGASLATGEVVVYCDSDCVYESGWLRSLVSPFAKDEVNVVAGETVTRGEGAYGLAMGIAYIFPRFSNQEGLRKADRYFLNNVAFRREFLLQNPIPTDLALYRGNCGVHAVMLRKRGHTIWRQPQARATHAPPEGVSHFFWRFLLMGRDHHLLDRLLAEAKAMPASPQATQSTAKSADATVKASSSTPIRSKSVFERVTGKLGVLSGRLGTVVKDEPQRIIHLPLAIPIAFASTSLIAIGRLITSFNRDFVLNAYLRSQGELPVAPATPTSKVSQV